MALNDNYDGCIIVANIVEKKNNNAHCTRKLVPLSPKESPNITMAKITSTSVIFR